MKNNDEKLGNDSNYVHSTGTSAVRKPQPSKDLSYTKCRGMSSKEGHKNYKKKEKKIFVEEQKSLKDMYDNFTTK